MDHRRRRLVDRQKHYQVFQTPLPNRNSPLMLASPLLGLILIAAAWRSTPRPRRDGLKLLPRPMPVAE